MLSHIVNEINIHFDKNENHIKNDIKLYVYALLSYDVPIGMFVCEYHPYDKRKIINAEHAAITIHFHPLLLDSTFASADELSMSKDGSD